jgi:polysaccharide export outer membrane protein
MNDIARKSIKTDYLHHFHRHCLAFVLAGFLALVAGCSSVKNYTNGLLNVKTAQTEKADIQENTEGIKIETFLLSPGDKINIYVFQHDELTRKVNIPPNGRFYYPIVGEIDVAGKSLQELREIITTGLSEYNQQELIPGDEILISVYQHDELRRQFIIPPDGFISLPLIGEIDAKGKTYREIRTIIQNKLVKFIIDPQVEVDITKPAKPKRIVNPEVGIEVVEYSGHKVFVLGEVVRPGVYLADGNIKVIEAILLAYGPTKDAKKQNVLLIRGGIKNEKPELIVIDFEKAVEEGDTSQNIVVQAGDIVYMPRSVIGDVKNFFANISAILNPIVQLEGGYLIGKQIEQIHKGGGSGGGVPYFPPP